MSLYISPPSPLTTHTTKLLQLTLLLQHYNSFIFYSVIFLSIILRAGGRHRHPTLLIQTVSLSEGNMLIKKGAQIVSQREYRIKRIVASRRKGCARGLPPSGKGRHVD